MYIEGCDNEYILSDANKYVKYILQYKAPSKNTTIECIAKFEMTYESDTLSMRQIHLSDKSATIPFTGDIEVINFQPGCLFYGASYSISAEEELTIFNGWSNPKDPFPFFFKHTEALIHMTVMPIMQGIHGRPRDIHASWAAVPSTVPSVPDGWQVDLFSSCNISQHALTILEVKQVFMVRNVTLKAYQISLHIIISSCLDFIFLANLIL